MLYRTSYRFSIEKWYTTVRGWFGNTTVHAIRAAGTDIQHSQIALIYGRDGKQSRLVGQLHDFLFYFFTYLEIYVLAAIGTDTVNKIFELQCYSVIHYQTEHQ